jgi:hypothetical protein
MGSAILQQCGKARNCTVRLSDITPFKWDKMFSFEYGVSRSDREKAVGISFKTHELERQIVFVRDGKVILNEFLPTDIEKPVLNSIVFVSGGSGSASRPFACQYTAVFQATYDDFGSGIPFYLLKLVN